MNIKYIPETVRITVSGMYFNYSILRISEKRVTSKISITGSVTLRISIPSLSSIKLLG